MYVITAVIVVELSFNTPVVVRALAQVKVGLSKHRIYKQQSLVMQ